MSRKFANSKDVRTGSRRAQERCDRLRRSLLGLACCAVLAFAGCQNVGSSNNLHGVRAFYQNQPQAAVQRFQQAIATNPQDAESYYNLAATYHYLARRQPDSSMMRQAESLYHQCLDLQPNHAPCYRALAVLLSDTDRPHSAFTLLKRWVERSPQLAEPKIELARLHDEFGEQQSAQRYLTQAIDIDPRNSRAWTAMGHLREKQGKLAQALNNYEQAYRLNSYQPGVAQRISGLQQRLAQNPTGTRTVENFDRWRAIR